MLGVAAVQTVAILWNFAGPVSTPLAAATLALGWIGLALPTRLSGPRLDVRIVAAMAAVAFAVTPVLMLRVFYSHDVGFYVLPLVRWAQASALPLGLANLSARLGFNSGWFVLDALLRRPLLPSDTLPSIAPAVVITLALTCGVTALRACPDASRKRGAALAALAILLFLGTATASAGLNSPASDLPALLGWSTVAALTLSGFADRDAAATDLLAVTLVAALTITAKLSALPIAVVPAILAWRMQVPRRTVLVGAGLVMLVLAPWLARGFWTSGCFMFPATGSCLPRVWWSVPLELVRKESLNVVNWAKEPYWKEGGVRPDWMLPWLRRAARSSDVQAPLVVVLGAWAFGRGAVTFVRRVRGVALVGAASAQLLFVGVMAPDPRFAMGALWVVAFAIAWDRMRSASGRAWMGFVVCLGALGPASARGWLDQSRGFRHAGDAPAVWLTPPRLDLQLPFTWLAVDGGDIRVASPSMLPAPACWGIEPPCAPYAPVGLRIRSSGDRIVGFHVETEASASAHGGPVK